MPNPEQLHENIADINEPGKEKGHGFEIVQTRELRQVIDQASDLAERIERDQNVTAQEVLDLESSLEQLKITAFGEEMTVGEYRQIPDLEKNKEIWQRIQDKTFRSGIFDAVTRQLTYINSAMIKHLKHVATSEEYWREADGERPSNLPLKLHLCGIKKMSEQALQELVAHEGELDFGLSELSEHQARILSTYEGKKLRLVVSKELDETVVQHLASIKTPDLELYGIKDLTKEVAASIANFSGTHLTIYGLDKIQPDAVSELEKFKGQLYLEIKAITPGLAEKLAEREDPLYLYSLERIDLETLKKFSKTQPVTISLQRINELDDDIIQFLKTSPDRQFFLNMLIFSEATKKQLS